MRLRMVAVPVFIGRTIRYVMQPQLGDAHIRRSGESSRGAGHRAIAAVQRARAGFKGQTPDGETHMERGGPDGLTMLFSTHAPDGRLFEVLDASGPSLSGVSRKSW